MSIKRQAYRAKECYYREGAQHAQAMQRSEGGVPIVPFTIAANANDIGARGLRFWHVDGCVHFYRMIAGRRKRPCAVRHRV